jgi:O-acetylserine/cysteine efflux transporter
VVLIVGEPSVGSDLVGVGLVLTASFFWAVANIQIKQLGEIDSFALSGWMAFFAAPQLFVASAVIEHDQIAALQLAGWRAYSAVAYMAVFVTIISYTMWYPMMRKYPINQMMPFTLLVPVFGVLSGVLLLNETLGLNMLLGGLATILGVGIIVLRRPQLPEPKNISPT